MASLDDDALLAWYNSTQMDLDPQIAQALALNIGTLLTCAILYSLVKLR